VRNPKVALKAQTKGGVGFGNALNLAVMVGITRPLLDYIASKPLSHSHDRAMLAGYIRELLKHIDELVKQVEPPRGRRHRNPGKAPDKEKAERNAAWLVAFTQDVWKRQHDRERVPAAVTDRMIREARHAAARVLRVPVSKISKDNIRNALKSGRVVVR
jgi:hypothetical protein